MNRDQAQTAIAAVEGAAMRLATAATSESELEDARALVKVEGIKRLMEAGPNPLTGKPHSVSSAEAVIEQDAGYMDHRYLQREAVAATILMRAKYEAAKLRARLSVELVRITDGNSEDL